jgi:hypothetical protein
LISTARVIILETDFLWRKGKKAWLAADMYEAVHDHEVRVRMIFFDPRRVLTVVHRRQLFRLLSASPGWNRVLAFWVWKGASIQPFYENADSDWFLLGHVVRADAFFFSLVVHRG